MQIGKGLLNNKEKDILAKYQSSVESYIYNLDNDYRKKYDELMSKYYRLGQIQDYSFQLDLNIELQFIASIDLANQAGVVEKDILHSEIEIDSYFIE